MKLGIVFLITTVFIGSCSDYHSEIAHIDDLPELVSESKKALVYLNIRKKAKRPFYRDEDLLAHYYGGKKLPALRPKGGTRGSCSAFFIDLANGYLATNQHCVDNTKRIDLELANGKVYRGKVVGADKHTDVALLKVIDQSFDRTGLGELKFADQRPVQGDKVLALGAPKGLKGGSTTGSITSLNHPKNRRPSLVYPYNSTLPNYKRALFGEYIQHDALLQGGNSGGPLLNTEGQVIGINSHLVFDIAGIINRGSSSYAVSYTTVEHVIDQLRDSGSCKWGDIGVVSWQRLEVDLRKILQIDDYPQLPDYETGAVVTEVTGSNTSLQEGDIVFAIDGEKITDHIDASNTVLFSKPGDRIQIGFIRDGKVKKKNVKVFTWHDLRDDRPITKIAKLWGLWVAEIDKGSRFYQTTKQDGLLVIHDSNPTEHNRAGCYLVSIDNWKISTVKQFAKYLKGKKEAVLHSLCFNRATKIYAYSTLVKL